MEFKMDDVFDNGSSSQTYGQPMVEQLDTGEIKADIYSTVDGSEKSFGTDDSKTFGQNSDFIVKLEEAQERSHQTGTEEDQPSTVSKDKEDRSGWTPKRDFPEVITHDNEQLKDAVLIGLENECQWWSKDGFKQDLNEVVAFTVEDLVSTVENELAFDKPFPLPNYLNTGDMNQTLLALFGLEPFMEVLKEMNENAIKKGPVTTLLLRLYKEYVKQKAIGHASTKMISLMRELWEAVSRSTSLTWNLGCDHFLHVVWTKMDKEFETTKFSSMENPIRQFFQIQVKIELVCPGCNQMQKEPLQEAFIVDLDVTEGVTELNSQLIMNYFHCETVCDKCKWSVMIPKYKVTCLPRTLCITVDRNSDEMDTNSDGQPIILQELDLYGRNSNGIIENESVAKYTLMAVICNDKAVSFGCQRFVYLKMQDGSWYLCDDMEASKRTFQEVKNRSQLVGTCFFYVQTHNDCDGQNAPKGKVDSELLSEEPKQWKSSEVSLSFIPRDDELGF